MHLPNLTINTKLIYINAMQAGKSYHYTLHIKEPGILNAIYSVVQMRSIYKLVLVMILSKDRDICLLKIRFLKRFIQMYVKLCQCFLLLCFLYRSYILRFLDTQKLYLID